MTWKQTCRSKSEEAIVITARQLLAAEIDAEDGPLGAVHDLYFDPHTWALRYLVVDTGKWLPGRKVLVVPEVIDTPWHNERPLPVRLSRDQIRSSPEIDTEQPVGRRAEELLHRHFTWNPYWGDLAAAPIPQPAAPPLVASDADRHAAELEAEASTETPLRSVRIVRGYRVDADDGRVGSLADFLIDDDLSRVLFLAVDLKAWLFDKEVLVEPAFVSRIDWATSTVHLGATQQAVRSRQEYHPAA
jgi:hypothetical protein